MNILSSKMVKSIECLKISQEYDLFAHTIAKYFLTAPENRYFVIN